jgi:hypothetical protein
MCTSTVIGSENSWHAYVVIEFGNDSDILSNSKLGNIENYLDIQTEINVSLPVNCPSRTTGKSYLSPSFEKYNKTVGRYDKLIRVFT